MGDGEKTFTLFILYGGRRLCGCKDKWRNIPVDYYIEKEYEPYAKQIYGNTPEMIEFYSKYLNYDYPWAKYAQISGRDYVSGAMENTTATLHGDAVQQNRVN